MLDLSQKVVSEDPELYSDPREAAALVSLSDSLRPVMLIGQYGRRSRGPGIGDSLSSLVKVVAWTQ